MMTQFIRLANVVLKQSAFSNCAFGPQNVYIRAFVNSVTRSVNKLQIEDLHDTEISSLPNHLKSYALQSADTVLSYVKAKKVSVRNVVGLLKALRVQTLLKKTNLYELHSTQFEALCHKFAENCHQYQPASLISGLRSLLEIGIPSDTKMIRDIEKVVLDRMKEFGMTQLIGCLHLHSKYLNTDIQKQVAAQGVVMVEKQISEISMAAEVLMLLQILHLFDKKSVSTMMEKFAEIFGKMDEHELARAISILSEKSCRHKSLLVNASLQLRQKANKPTIKETVSVLLALHSLNFYDVLLLSYLTEDRESDIANLKQASLTSALLKACGLLKWKHEGILDACGQWISDNMNRCSSQTFVSYILTTAALNYEPKNMSVLKNILSCLTFESVNSKDIWLDVVWSLAILNYLDKDMLINVLSPDFYKSLLGESDFPSLSNNLKLMNLKYVLKGSYPEYVFSCDLFVEPQEMPRSKESENCRKDVLNALSNLVPNEKYMCTNLSTDMGVSIDAEFIVNKKGKPLRIDVYGLKAKPSVVNKALPRTARRIALVIWMFRDYTLNVKELTGVNALAVRLLSAQGYVVVQVPYEEFIKEKTEVKKVVYLSKLINAALEDSMKKK